MDVSIATVKVALHRGRVRLRELARGARGRACM
jgi:DNA-directed RNA polymerase specialized sigma24 family protein